MGGRLEDAPMSLLEHHPVILHQKDVLVKTIITTLHSDFFHTGPTLTLSALNRDYHIIGTEHVVKEVCKCCVQCLKSTEKVNPLLIGQLPSQHIPLADVFAVTGMDYAGPFITKEGHVRKPVLLKSYFCIFVCFVTKAVHNVTTEALLTAFKCFVAGRDSDIDTSFIGACNELHDCY